MASFVLVPGAGGAASSWRHVVASLEANGHEATAVALPGGDAHAGLEVYTARVLDAIAARNVVLVAHSLGGFTAAQVAARTPVARIVLVNAMIPSPGETAGAWWGNTGAEEARISAAERRGYGTKLDLATYFFHDVDASDVDEDHAEAPVVFADACRFERWPDVPIDVVIGRDDRFFPADFQVRTAKERLGSRASVDVIPGGHLLLLSNPNDLVARLR